MPHDLRSLPNLNFMLYVLQHREKRTTNPPPRLIPAALIFCLHLLPPSSSSSSTFHIFQSTATITTSNPHHHPLHPLFTFSDQQWPSPGLKRTAQQNSLVRISYWKITSPGLKRTAQKKFTRSYKLLKNHVIFQNFVFLSSSSLEWKAWFSTIQLFRWSINVFLFIYFCAHIEVRGRARISTLNGTGHNTTKETVERCGKTPTAELKAKIEGDPDKQWVWRGTRGRRGCMGWTRGI